MKNVILRNRLQASRRWVMEMTGILKKSCFDCKHGKEKSTFERCQICNKKKTAADQFPMWELKTAT